MDHLLTVLPLSSCYSLWH